MAAETQQMMSRSPAFYSPLHSMAWAGAFSGAAAGGGAGSSGTTTPPHSASKGSSVYSGSFGYPPTPPKESPGASGTPASLGGAESVLGGGYPDASGGVAGSVDTEGAGQEMKPEMKPSADHLMQSMALSGYPGMGVGGVGLCGSHKHKSQDGEYTPCLLSIFAIHANVNHDTWSGSPYPVSHSASGSSSPAPGGVAAELGYYYPDYSAHSALFANKFVDRQGKSKSKSTAGKNQSS